MRFRPVRLQRLPLFDQVIAIFKKLLKTIDMFRALRRTTTVVNRIGHFFPSLRRAHRGGDALPFRRQAGKIMGQSGEIAIDRNGSAARCINRWIFQRGG